MLHKVNDGFFRLSCDNCKEYSVIFSFNYFEANEDYPISLHGGWQTSVNLKGRAEDLCPKCQIDLLEKEAEAAMKEVKRTELSYDEFGNLIETVEVDLELDRNIFNVKFGSINIPTIYSVNLFKYHEKALILILGVVAAAALAGFIVGLFVKHPAFLILLNCIFVKPF